jgi:predicted nucleic acid-binding protein
MELALTDLFQAKWSDRIHEEWIKNALGKRDHLTRDKLDYARQKMDEAVPDALTTYYESLIEGLNLPDSKDNHVLAAAIKASASVIVTYNTKDFPQDYLGPYGIEAQHPDTFIQHLTELSLPAVLQAAHHHRKRLKNPPFDVERYLNNLRRQQLTMTVKILNQYSDLI